MICYHTLRSVIGTANWQEAPDAFISKASNRITVDHTGKEIVPHFAMNRWWGRYGRGWEGGHFMFMSLMYVVQHTHTTPDCSIEFRSDIQGNSLTAALSVGMTNVL